MNDDSGPITDWPCKSKIKPKMKIIAPTVMTKFPFFMLFLNDFH